MEWQFVGCCCCSLGAYSVCDRQQRVCRFAKLSPGNRGSPGHWANYPPFTTITQRPSQVVNSSDWHFLGSWHTDWHGAKGIVPLLVVTITLLSMRPQSTVALHLTLGSHTQVPSRERLCRREANFVFCGIIKMQIEMSTSGTVCWYILYSSAKTSWFAAAVEDRCIYNKESEWCGS